MNRSEYDDVKANLIKKSLEREKTDVYVPVERRKREDGRLNLINLMSIFLWGAILIIVALVLKAGNQYPFIRNLSFVKKDLSYWNVDLLKGALIITLVTFFATTTCIILNFTRKKRRTDKIKKSLILCEMISFGLTIFLLLKLFRV